MKFSLFAVTFLLTYLSSFAQSTGIVSGNVIDKSSQKVIAGVSIQVVGTSSAAISDSLGQFRISIL